MKPTHLTVRGPLTRPAELRTRLPSKPATVGSYVLMVEIRKPGDTMPVQAELVLGQAIPSVYLAGLSRARAMRTGTEVLVEAEGFAMRRSGRGKARTECLALAGVRDITLTAPLMPAADHFTALDDRRYENQHAA